VDVVGCSRKVFRNTVNGTPVRAVMTVVVHKTSSRFYRILLENLAAKGGKEMGKFLVPLPVTATGRGTFRKLRAVTVRSYI
jgi:hypothetical protein